MQKSKIKVIINFHLYNNESHVENSSDYLLFNPREGYPNDNHYVVDNLSQRNLFLSVVTKGFTKYLRERIINLDKLHLAKVAHTFILPLEPLRWNWKKVPASSKGSSFLTLVSAIVASFPHSLHVSKSHAKQLKRLVPLLRTNSPLDQHFSSLHLKKVGPISEGQMRNSSPHWLHGRLVLGISLKTSRI